MKPIALYKKFNHEYFYHFHKHSTDVEIEELGKTYGTWLNKNERLVDEILTGRKHPDELREETQKQLESLARAEAKFPNELPQDLRAEHFESETGFSHVEGKLRRLVDGQSHLVRLIKPAEYDKNYWFYKNSGSSPQHVFCSEFGLDLIEYLKAVTIANRAKLRNLRRAVAFRKDEVNQFWTLSPYLHYNLMELGYSWSASLTTLLKIAGKRFASEGRPFAGAAKFQLGYDERMPTHLLARMESMRDIACLKTGHYTTDYGIALPDRLSEPS